MLLLQLYRKAGTGKAEFVKADMGLLNRAYFMKIFSMTLFSFQKCQYMIEFQIRHNNGRKGFCLHRLRSQLGEFFGISGIL